MGEEGPQPRPHTVGALGGNRFFAGSAMLQSPRGGVKPLNQPGGEVGKRSDAEEIVVRRC
jgi:hypothetical protein